MVKVYIGESSPLALLHGKEYKVLSVEHGRYRIIDEAGKDYLYPKEQFKDPEDEKFSFGYFMELLEKGKNIDETEFYFTDGPKDDYHILGYLPQYEKPYCVGYCDAEDGAEFATAEELVNAKIFDGKSLKERWNETRITALYGIPINDWRECAMPSNKLN